MKAVAGVLVFTKDCMLTSANLAANVVLAVACVAIDRWKDESCMSATDSDSLGGVRVHCGQNRHCPFG